MKICVLSCSPKKETSLTLQSARFLKKFYPEDEFDINYTATVNCPQEVIDKACDSDLIMILSSIFHLNVHAQMISMLDQLSSGMKAKLGDSINDKFFTYITTSNFLYEIGAHKYVTSWAKHEKLNFLRPLSLKDDSMLMEIGREELYKWFMYTKETMALIKSGETPKVTEKRRIAIVNDGQATTCETVKKMYEDRGCEAEIINLKDYKLTPCNACFGCYSNRVCPMKDDMVALMDKIGTNTDMILTMGNLKLGMLSQQFKIYTDRHVQFGRCGTSDEMVIMALLESDEDDEERFASLNDYAQWDQAMNGIGRDYNVGTYLIRVKDEIIDVTRMIDDSILVMNNELIGQRNTFSENLNTRFAELAYYLQFMVPLDYQHYKKDGYYDKRPLNTNVKYVHDVKEGMLSCKMRMMAYDMAYEQAGDKPVLNKRRQYKGMSFVEHKRKGDAEDSNSKGGFKGLFGKKK